MPAESGGNSGGYGPAVEKWVLDYRLKETNPLDLQVAFFKFGGSTFRAPNFEEIIAARIKQFRKLHKGGYPLILTTGGGKVHQVTRGMSEALGVSDAVFRESAGRALATQAHTIADLVGETGLYVEPGALDYITGGMLKDKIPVLSTIGPKYIDHAEIITNGGDRQYVSEIPQDKSDAHTLVIAHYFGQKRVIFGKVTRGGIWVVDPNVTENDGDMYLALQGQLHRLGYTENQRLAELTATDVLEGKICRLGGDNRTDHLAEDLALRYFLNPKSSVEQIRVVDITDPDQIQKAVEQHGSGRRSPFGSILLKA
ncbi:hypothetical protein CMO93_01220 [Candidatus Woesearchaeota archaeon]|nr:hypothetical protein [Candidatus Woesearchaeota archaeon]|tara:strand:+ start:4626 stop:5561 length:936 start_codon:yes stop_codon:yes gene_type:complete